ncbi:MAG: heme exporter protein D [Candidatus Azotimanducaceae bacterium]|jgi:heme exporter protein D
MQFDSIAEIINMNGHGIYVWSVYLLGISVLILNVIRPRMLLKKFYSEQAQILKRKAALQDEKPIELNGE